MADGGNDVGPKIQSLQAAAKAVLGVYNPALQRVGLALTGPGKVSSNGTPTSASCSPGSGTSVGVGDDNNFTARTSLTAKCDRDGHHDQGLKYGLQRGLPEHCHPQFQHHRQRASFSSRHAGVTSLLGDNLDDNPRLQRVDQGAHNNNNEEADIGRRLDAGRQPNPQHGRHVGPGRVERDGHDECECPAEPQRRAGNLLNRWRCAEQQHDREGDQLHQRLLGRNQLGYTDPNGPEIPRYLRSEERHPGDHPRDRRPSAGRLQLG